MTTLNAASPEQVASRPGLLREAAGVCRDLWSWRHLVRAFVVYDIKNDKRNHIMGNLWHLLNPVLNMLIFMFVVQVVFKHDTRQPYPVFFFAGSIMFRLWTGALSRGSSVLVQQAGLIKACYFPRIAAVMPVTLGSLYELVIESLVLAALMAIFGVAPGWQVVLVIPLVLVTLMGTTGAVLILSCLGARFRDLSSIIQHVNRMLFYFTPVMYPLDLIPERWRDLYMLNPVSAAIEMTRQVVIEAQAPASGLAGYYAAFCVGLLIIGLLTFARLQGKVTKYL